MDSLPSYPNVDEWFDKRALYLSRRHTDEALRELATAYLSSTYRAATEKHAAELGSGRKGSSTLHSDRFLTAEMHTLPPDYRVSFTANDRSSPDAAAAFAVISGELTISRNGGESETYRVGTTLLFTDNENVTIESATGAGVVQLCSPRKLYGRRLSLPSPGRAKPVAERPIPWRTRLNSRYHEGVAAAQDAVSRFATRAFPRRGEESLLSTAQNRPRRVLFAHAHPDDETTEGAALLARLVAEGDEVLLVTFTGGEQGSVLNPVPDSALADALRRKTLLAVRHAEMAASIVALGLRADQHRWLGFKDSGMPAAGEEPPADSLVVQLPAARREFLKIVREFQPDVIVTYDENGGYPHPDHRAVNQVTVEALKEYRPADRPWLLYYQFPYVTRRERREVNRSLRLAGREPIRQSAKPRLGRGLGAWFRETLAIVAVRSGQYVANKCAAQAAHPSQIDRECAGLLAAQADSRGRSQELFLLVDHDPRIRVPRTRRSQRDLFWCLPSGGHQGAAPEAQAGTKPRSVIKN